MYILFWKIFYKSVLEFLLPTEDTLRVVVESNVIQETVCSGQD